MLNLLAILLMTPFTLSHGSELSTEMHFSGHYSEGGQHAKIVTNLQRNGISDVEIERIDFSGVDRLVEGLNRYYQFVLEVTPLQKINQMSHLQHRKNSAWAEFIGQLATAVFPKYPLTTINSDSLSGFLWAPNRTPAEKVIGLRRPLVRQNFYFGQAHTHEQRLAILRIILQTEMTFPNGQVALNFLPDSIAALLNSNSLYRHAAIFESLATGAWAPDEEWARNMQNAGDFYKESKVVKDQMDSALMRLAHLRLLTDPEMLIPQDLVRDEEPAKATCEGLGL